MKSLHDITIAATQNLKEGIGNWDIKITGDKWQDIINNAEKNVILQLQIPGFRKGKVPAAIAKKHVTESSVLKNASNKAIKIAFDYGLEQKDLEIMPVTKPEVEIKAIDRKFCHLLFSFDLPLKVEVTKFTGYDIKKPNNEVTQEEIEQQIKLLKDRFAVYSPKEDSILEKGDTAIFDFKGTINNQEFAGNKGEDTQLEIGSNKFIPGFEEQMIGMKAGETKTIKVEFPKDYHVESLAQKEAEFVIHLKEIKIKTISDDEEELVKDVNFPNVNNYSELLTYIRENLAKEKAKNAREEFINDYVEAVANNSKIILPKTVINSETDRVINDFKQQLIQQNIDLENYKKITGLADTDIRREAQKDAIWQIQSHLIAEEIVKHAQLDVSDIEIEEYLTSISNETKLSVDQIKQQIKDLSFIKNGIKRKKAWDWILENNNKIN